MSEEHRPEQPPEHTTLRTTEVDLGGLVGVLATHLYSTPLVALRELVQNAHDSHTRRALEAPEAAADPVIRVHADPARRTVSVEDTGAGLTEPEIHAYLATVGTGYTRMLRELTGNKELIGAFGLGFLSAFSVAEEVTVTTTSHREPALGHRYRSRGGEQYTVAPCAARSTPGTVVELLLKPEHAALAEPDTLREVLARYCVLLSVPVYVGEDERPVNAVAVPWRQGLESARSEPAEYAARMRFATAFGRRFEPLTAFPVTPAPGGPTDAVGLLWVQDGATYGSSDNRELAVYLRGMLLTEDARDLLPSWAGFIGGVIESDRLTPTASREDLQRDEHYRALRQALTEAVVDGLYETARLRPEVWRRVLARHGQELLGAALCEERLFTLLADDVPVPSSQGELTAGALRAAGSGTVHVALGGEGGFEEMLYRAMRVPIARGDRYAVLPFLRRYAALRGCRLVELGGESGTEELFREPDRPLAEEETAWLSAALTGEGEQLVPARFDPPGLPLVLVPDRAAQLKARLEDGAAAARIPSAALRLARSFTARTDGAVRARLYLNLDSPAVDRLLTAYRAGHTGSATAAGLLRSVKVIMAAAGATGPADSGADLTAALTGISTAVAALTAPTDPHSSEHFEPKADA
ncbi:molecular chaperone HtpG [Kitasatospora sp. MMS16-BH015]|uniref:ATP-binding protein n=1 Tax=Kitasatospora sp. MMS16-BH015 TaxID=2018025 RepID=UPI000CA2B628|nr:ATP-binding protein [Kitasatospora sp. MMS16-BH015]AUG78146.1 molecular chaperone HtpG [Kitasatospora sp. MMS16-BH015]